MTDDFNDILWGEIRRNAEDPWDEDEEDEDDCGWVWGDDDYEDDEED